MLQILGFGGEHAYQVLRHEQSGGESEKQSLDSSDSLPEHRLLEGSTARTSRSQTRLVPHIILAFSSVLFLGSLIILAVASRRLTDQACVKQLNTPSPFLDSVEYEWKMFDNEFRKETIYRGKPTVELEQAWDDLWNYGSFNVPKSMLPGLNKTDEGLRHFTPEQGGGAVGLLEAFHQIHCLNLIRQYTYRDQWDYSASPSFEGSDELVRDHVDHCIETLRINLMCTADVTPFLVRQNPDRPLGMEPDFNSLHKCRKWDQIVEKAKELQVHRQKDPAHTHIRARSL